MMRALVLVLSGCGLLTDSTEHKPASRRAALSGVDSDAIMGFETTAGWSLMASAKSTTASSTTTRTQGSFALSLDGPSNRTTLTSLPVASTASALAGVGDVGAMFEVDVLLPLVQGNAVNSGRMQLFVRCPSRGLYDVLVGAVAFNPFRLGVYNTMKLPIPTAVSRALGGDATFDDLTFEIAVTSPGMITGSYLFDKLRVHSGRLVTAGVGTRPPLGYGGSIDLVVFGGTSVVQSFALEPVQVPSSLHLKLGTAGNTSVQLALGLDGTPSLSCTYAPDPLDATGTSYRLTSCTAGAQAGDLVSANWVSLAIVGGDSSIKLRAQLASNPVGDQVGAGIIPPMPTFWGDFDGCVPSPSPGTIVTTSASCARQVAQANQIVTDYFNLVNQSNVAPNWIVTPVPERARRHGDGSAHDNLTGPPPPPGDPPLPFDDEGHLNQGGDWDAYWRLSGEADPESVAGSDRTTTFFSATFGTHVVLFGEDVDVASIEADVRTATTESTPVAVGPSQTGTLHLFLFGIEIPTGGISTDLTTFNFEEDKEFDYDLPPIQIWIFSVTIGATATVGFTATGSFPVNSSGFNLVFTPQAALGAHVKGGVSLYIASGGVDAKVQLLSVFIPVTVSEGWGFNFDPAVCDATLTGSQKAQAMIGSAGGEIDLVASFGVCPFCKDESWPLFKWAPLLTYTEDLFSGPVADTFGLPPAVCTKPLTVQIDAPTSGGTTAANLPITLLGHATATDHAGFVPCNDLTWTFTPANASDSVSPSTASGCSPQVTFAQPANGSSASWTINLSASESFTNAFETITESGTATPVSLTVSTLAGGDYITLLTDSNGTSYTPNLASCSGFTFCITNSLNAALSFTVQGLVSGASGALSTSFTVTDSSNNTTALTTNNATSATPSATWTPPVVNGTNQGNFTITMTTTAGGSSFGTATATVAFSVLQ
jgi:hypothetical protein